MPENHNGLCKKIRIIGTNNSKGYLSLVFINAEKLALDFAISPYEDVIANDMMSDII